VAAGVTLTTRLLIAVLVPICGYAAAVAVLVPIIVAGMLGNFFVAAIVIGVPAAYLIGPLAVAAITRFVRRLRPDSAQVRAAPVVAGAVLPFLLLIPVADAVNDGPRLLLGFFGASACGAFVGTFWKPRRTLAPAGAVGERGAGKQTDSENGAGEQADAADEARG
jgi:hypothetical protein